MRVFEKILADLEYRKQPHAREMVQFCTHVTRNMFKRLLYTPEPEKPVNETDGNPDGELCYGISGV